jgi:hypothetical protein
LITGTDTCGRITLRRETVAAALKKAAELADDGCHDISITAPDGQLIPANFRRGQSASNLQAHQADKY